MAQSSVTTQGDWTQAEVTTSIAGTTQEVLVASVVGGTSATSAPSVTWTPAISQDGRYAVYLVTPGCTAAGTCASRTFVQVTATPKDGSATQTTVDQTNSQDQSTLIYNGTLAAVQGSLSVTMTLASGGAPTAGKTYELVADYINLVAASTNGTSTRIERGYGLLEYPLVRAGTFGDAVPTAQVQSMNASATMTNATGLDAVAFGLAQGSTVSSLVADDDGSASKIFFGGNFTYRTGSNAATNVMGYHASEAILTPNGGLNGPVKSVTAVDGALYAAGTFTATADNAVQGLAGLAKWNYSASASAWEALSGAPNVGPAVAQLAAAEHANGLSQLILAGGAGSGLAYYDVEASAWNSTAAGFFLGNLTAVATGAPTNANATTYLAGNVLAASRSSVSGGAVLSEDKHNQPVLSPFGFSFNSSASSGSTKSQRPARRSAVVHAAETTLDRRSFSRVSLEARAPAPSPAVNLTLPSPLNAIIDAGEDGQVLAGTFWKNGSDGLMLVGGAFATPAGANAVGVYDPSAASVLSPLSGLVLDGVVTTLRTVDNTLWIGGNFSTADGRQGLSNYDLAAGAVVSSIPSLAGTSILLSLARRGS